MAELKDMKGQPDLVCYQGSDPNTPSTAKTDNNGGATIFNRKTGLAVYHVLAGPPEQDALDRAARAALDMIGLGLPPPDRAGRLVLSRKPGEPGFDDPLGLAGSPFSLNLSYSQDKDQKTPQLKGCQIDDPRHDDPDFSIQIPVVPLRPELKVAPPRAPGAKVAEAAPGIKPEMAMG